MPSVLFCVATHLKAPQWPNRYIQLGTSRLSLGAFAMTWIFVCLCLCHQLCSSLLPAQLKAAPGTGTTTKNGKTRTPKQVSKLSDRLPLCAVCCSSNINCSMQGKHCPFMIPVVSFFRSLLFSFYTPQPRSCRRNSSRMRPQCERTLEKPAHVCVSFPAFV